MSSGDSNTNYEVVMSDGTPVIRITGDLDHYSAPVFRSCVSDLISKGHKAIVVDMASVEFMDSGGMAGIVFAAKRLADLGGRLILANCNPRVNRKLEIGGLSNMPQLLVVCASLDEALQRAQTGQDP